MGRGRGSSTVWSTRLHPFQSPLIDRETDRGTVPKTGARDQTSVLAVWSQRISAHYWNTPSRPFSHQSTRGWHNSNWPASSTYDMVYGLVYPIRPVGRRRWNEFLDRGYDTSLPSYARGKRGKRAERERGNPKAVGTVSCQLETWRHGDMWRDMGDTRGSRAILSPSLGIWETFSCYVSGPAWQITWLMRGAGYGVLRA